MRLKIPPINLYLFSQLEAEGREVKIYKNQNGKVIAANAIDPLKRLFEEKRSISKEQYDAGTKYQIDYGLANLTNHARPSWDGSPISSANHKKKDPRPDNQTEASKRIEDIKMLLQHAEDKWHRFQAAAGRKHFKSKKLIKITNLVIERQLSVEKSIILSGVHFYEFHKRIDEILTIMQNYYE